MKNLDQAIALIPILSKLPDTDLCALKKISSISSCPGARLLARSGSTVEHVSFVVEGGIKVCNATSDGKEITIALLGPGAHIGVVSLLSNAKRSTDIISTCRSELLSVESGDFLQFLNEFPALAISLLKSLSSRLKQTSEHLAENALYRLDQRLFLRLLELSEPVDLDGRERLIIKQRPSHQDLASF